MQTYRLTLEMENDYVVQKVLDLLNDFSASQVKIKQMEYVQDGEQKLDLSSHQPYEKVIEDDPLFGLFSAEMTHKLSDEEIEKAIVQGATERAMRSKSNYQ